MWIGVVIIFILLLMLMPDFHGMKTKKKNHKELLSTIKSTKSSEDNQERFRCPSCAEMVLVQAKMCRYCGRDLQDDARPANLSGERLRDSDLSGNKLSRANLSGADMLRANLRDADLSGADLQSADLDGADLRGADLSGADLRGATLRWAKYNTNTQWPGDFDPEAAGARLMSAEDAE